MPARDTVYVGERRALTRTRDGQLMFVNTHDLSLAPWLMLDGVWEPATTAVFARSVRSGMVVLDVGANIGYYTLLGAARVGPSGYVLAMEPDPQIFALLRDNVEVNGYTQRVRLSRLAAADRTGIMPFYQTRRHRGNGSLVENLNQVGDQSSEVRQIQVEAAPIDALGVGRIDVMKVDAEGSEARVFRGARETIARSRTILAIVEFWPRLFRCAGEDPAAFLEERLGEGFALGRIDDRRRRIVPAAKEELLAGGSFELVLRRFG